MVDAAATNTTKARLLVLDDGPAAGAKVQSIGVGGTLSVEAAAIPVGGGDRVDVQDVHGVDLLKSAALGLNHEEVDNPEQTEARATENQTVEVVDLLGDESGEERDQEVEQPVGSGSQSHGGGTVAGGVQLADDGPDQGTPGDGEGDDEQAGEDNHDLTGLGVVGAVTVGELVVTNEGVDEQAHEHPGSADHETLAAAAALNNPQRNQSSANVDGTENDRGNVRVRQAGGLEDGGAVVEEIVGARELLASLKNHTEKGAVEHTRAGEDLVPGVIAASGLSLLLVLNVLNLAVDELVIGGNTVQTSHDVAGLLNVALAVEPARRLGHEQDRATEEDGPEGGETVGNAPLGAVVVGILSTVGDLFG